MKEILFLDLFAGCGGLSEGFVRQGFVPVAYVEKDAAACNSLKTRQTYRWLKENKLLDIYHKYLRDEITRDELYCYAPDSLKKSVINAEISELTLNELFTNIESMLQGKKLDLIVGGPPCQAYSLVGRSRDKHKMLTDKRNYLYRYYAKFLHHFKPQYFVFENVTGLLSARDADGKKHIDSMIESFKEKGYATEYKVLSADDYGVPQKRKRVILVGRLGSEVGFFPDVPIRPWTENVWDVLNDLPKLKSNMGAWKAENGTLPLTHHISRYNSTTDLEIYKIAVDRWDKHKERIKYDDLPERLKTHRNRGVFKDRFKVVAGDISTSHTLVAHIGKDGHYYIHPDINQNRSLTPREAARLQTFPDDFFFESVGVNPSFSATFRQIGNAVPVVLSEAIASSLKDKIYEDRCKV